MRRKRWLVVSLAAAVAALLGTPLAAAPLPLPPAGSVPLQSTPSATAEAPLPGDLLTLKGEKVSVRYPPDALDRAIRVQARLEALVDLWSPWTARRLAWSAVLLRREEWRQAGFAGWGAPQRAAPGTFVIPAEGDDATVAFVRSLLGGALPQLPGEPVIGTREQAASLLVCDLLLELEAARELAATAPLSGDAPWVTGVLLQLAVRYAWERAEPEQTLAYVGIFDAMTAAQGGARAHRLADYRSALPYETELWFQAQFVRGADAIWVAEGWTGAARRLRHWGRKGEPVAAADLEKKYPGLATWKNAAFVP